MVWKAGHVIALLKSLQRLPITFQIKLKILSLALKAQMSWPLLTTMSLRLQPPGSSFCSRAPSILKNLTQGVPSARKAPSTPTRHSSHALFSRLKPTHFLGLLFLVYYFTHSSGKCFLSSVCEPGIVLGAGKWQQRWLNRTDRLSVLMQLIVSLGWQTV